VVGISGGRNRPSRITPPSDANSRLIELGNLMLETLVSGSDRRVFVHSGLEKMDSKTESGYVVTNRDSLILHWVSDISLNEQLCNPQYHESVRDSMVSLARTAGPCDLRVGNFKSPIWGDGSVNRLRKTRIYATEQAAKCTFTSRAFPTLSKECRRR